MTSRSDEETIKSILSILEEIVVLMEKLLKNEDKVASLLRQLLNSPEFADFAGKLSCYTDGLYYIINNNFDKLYKYADLILQELSQKECREELITRNEDISISRKLEKLGLSKEQAEKATRQGLGRTYSVKDFITKSVQEKFLEEYGQEFASSVVLSCRSAYCLGIKLSSLWYKIKDLKTVMGWDPKEAMERALLSNRVVQAIARHFDPDELDILVYNIRWKPQFKDLREIEDIIIKFLDKIERYNNKNNIIKRKKKKIQEEKAIPTYTIYNYEYKREKEEVEEKEKEEKKSKIEENKKKKSNKVKTLAILTIILFSILILYNINSGFNVFEYNKPSTTTETTPMAPLANRIVNTMSTSTGGHLEIPTAITTPQWTTVSIISNNINNSTATSNTKNYYIYLDLSDYIAEYSVNKRQFIDPVPRKTKYKNIPFNIYAVKNATIQEEVITIGGSTVTIKLQIPLKIKAIHLLTSIHFSCEGTFYYNATIGEIIIVHIDGKKERFYFRAGVNTDEWRRGYDSEKCHKFPWLTPALSGREYYYASPTRIIPSTWNLYYSKIIIKYPNDPIEKIIISDTNKDIVAFSINAITFEV